MNKYELAVYHTKSVLDEWLPGVEVQGSYSRHLAEVIVERLIAHGVIQSTDPEDLVDAR